MFATDPTKQRFHEKLAKCFIEKINGVENLELLPNSKLYLVSGKIKDKKELTKENPPKAKSLDFFWQYDDYKIYVSHKYTKDEGGAQENQYNDLKTFIEEANKCNAENTVFIAIADGEFYKRNNGKAGRTRIKNLKHLANTKNVFACAIEELESLLKNLKKKQDIISPSSTHHQPIISPS